MNSKKSRSGRRDFIKKGIAGLAGAAILPSVASAAKGVDKEEKKRKLVKRTLGRTGISLPVISIGAQAEDPAIYKAALDAGLVLFDTANTYGNGQHEQMLAEIVKDRPRDSYIIMTKVYQPMDQKTGHYKESVTSESFVTAFEASLQRLGVEYVDILHGHAVAKREAVMFEPVIEGLEKLKKDGKARFTGVSVHTNEPEVMDAVVEGGFYDVVLTSYNFRQPHAKEMDAAIARAAKAGVGIIAMKTQAGVYWDRERTKMIDMKAALKWVLRNENVHTTIPGFTTFEQLEEDLSVMADMKMTAEEKKALELGSLSGDKGLYCAQCRRCVGQCRSGLEVPALMRSYMYAYGYRNLAKAKETFRASAGQAIACNSCTECTVRCTMGFDIKAKVKDIARLENVPDDFIA